MAENESKKTNPSRKECEDIIKRILMTEVLEKGCNEHFRNPSDFMSYFQSLYPVSPGLTKQVQRAVKSLDLPKDKSGFYIIGKTQSQLDQDQEISFMLKKTSASVASFGEFDTVFLKCSHEHKNYLYRLLSESETFVDKYVTMMECSNGILFLTKTKSQLETMLKSLM